MRGKRLNRLLQLIATLRGPTSYNARRLAERFGCSRRNVYRDMAVLELAGIPVYHDPGHGDGGGYRIRSDWWFPSVGLTDKECLDLAVIARVAENRVIPLLDDVCAVRDKLLGTLPAKQQDLIRSASDLFDILGLHLADHSHCQKVMTTIQTALLSGKQVKARYRSPHDKTEVVLRLQPRRVFLCRQAWYMAAHDNKARQTQLYRIARFQTVELLKDAITVQPQFSLREFLGNAWTVYRGDRDWHVEIEFSPEAAELVAETRWHHTQELETNGDGSLRFRAIVSGLEEIKYWVLQWGPRAKVHKPLELKDAVAQLARDTSQLYIKRGK